MYEWFIRLGLRLFGHLRERRISKLRMLVMSLKHNILELEKKIEAYDREEKV